MKPGYTEKARKGFYFSFDAFMALSVMAATLAVVSQSSMVASDNFQVSNIDYRKSTTTGQDAMKLASQQDYYSFNNSFRQELVDDTVMTQSDFDKSIVDGVALLWAARNFSHAEEVTEKYFDSKIPEGYEYRLQVNEDGNKTVIYKSAEMSDNPKIVSSISRLVSGYKIDKPSEGFQSRARAVKSKTNQTKVVNIPMMGSGGTNLFLRLDKKFEVNASEIHGAKIYFSAHWGESNFNSNDVELNGNSLDIGGSNPSDWEHYAEKGGTTFGYDTANITDEVKNGWNSFYLDFKNQNNHHVHIHPGTRIEITYSGENQINAEDKREFFANIEGQGQNTNKKGGAWITKPFYIPENSTINNVSTRVNLKNIRDVAGRSDLEVYLNRKKVYAENLSGDAIRQVNLTSEAEIGNNVLSIYANTLVDEGEISGFGGYPENPTIYSDPENSPENSSSLYLDYDSPDTGLLYNKIELTTSEEIGGSADNPKLFSEEFRENVKLSGVFVNLAQLDSKNVTLRAGEDLDKVFRSPREFATPTKIGINREFIEKGESNDFKISEECTVNCSILPQTSIEKRMLVSSQVGYGNLFANKSASLEDAKQRLEEQLGEYADATSIESDTLSTGNQPYLWGPASVKLVIWRE